MKNHNICLAACLFLLLAASAQASDGKTDVTLSAGYNYSSGDYGQPISTQVHYAPFTLKVKHEEWTAKLIVPFLSISGPGVVVGDVPVGAPHPKGTESGLGDVTASLAWTHTLNMKGTTIELTGIGKLPTADEDRRLGTGLFDFTAQAGLIQPLGKFYVMANGGRKFNGANATFPLRDVWKYTVGGGYNITDATSVGAIYDYRGSQSKGGDPLEMATAYVSHNFGEGYSVQLYGSAGFSDASPDGAIGLQFNKDFDLF